MNRSPSARQLARPAKAPDKRAVRRLPPAAGVRSARGLNGALAALVAASLALTTFGATAAGASPRPALRHVPAALAHQLGHLRAPEGLAVDGGNLWVANAGDNTVSEFDASTGAFERVLSAVRYGFDSRWRSGPTVKWWSSPTSRGTRSPC